MKIAFEDHVGEHDVDAVHDVEYRERLFGGRRRHGLMPLLAQIRFGKDPDLVFILDDQNGGHRVLLRPERAGPPKERRRYYHPRCKDGK